MDALAPVHPARPAATTPTATPTPSRDGGRAAAPATRSASFAERVGPSRDARSAKAPAPGRPATAPKPAASERNALDEARRLAAECEDLDALHAALKTFTLHPLHAGARNTVFARGDAASPIMVIGEAPGKEEDAQGEPFVGRSGQLLDAAFAQAGLTGARAPYITNVVNWRPRGNATPGEIDIALCLPFLERHIALARPRLIALAGGVAAKSVLREETGIMRLRGQWRSLEVGGHRCDAIPLLHPAFVLRRPIAKRELWADILSISDRLDRA